MPIGMPPPTQDTQRGIKLLYLTIYGLFNEAITEGAGIAQSV
jgi:hypothetical protein